MRKNYQYVLTFFSAEDSSAKAKSMRNNIDKCNSFNLNYKSTYHIALKINIKINI